MASGELVRQSELRNLLSSTQSVNYDNDKDVKTNVRMGHGFMHTACATGRRKRRMRRRRRSRLDRAQRADSH